mgnify:CR=1 FL=1
MRFVISGGAPLDPKIQKGFIDLGINVAQGYGLTETSPVIAAENMYKSRTGSIGVPMENVTVEIVNKDDNGIGELRAKGPNVMLGYYENDEETNKVLKDGWFYTGDLGYRNEDGLLFYSSRLKRMIITNGYNVYPIELEEIISKCECVSSCTVVGIPHKTKGQTPKAVIVLKDGYEDTLETKAKVRAYCKEHLAAYAVPSEIEYRKSVPVTAIGKVAYRELEKKHKKK